MTIEPIILSGRHVRLEPFSERHREELRPIAQDERIWAVTTSAFGAKFDPYFDKALSGIDAGTELGFVVRLHRSGNLVGATRFLAIEPAHKRLEIGATWYHPDVWATAVNPECKLLLMQHAFEVLGYHRVEFKTDRRNERSQGAIRKLGALHEGVFRKHMILPDGHIRDSVWFSIVDSDWSGVKAGLLRRIAMDET